MICSSTGCLLPCCFPKWLLSVCPLTRRICGHSIFWPVVFTVDQQYVQVKPCLLTNLPFPFLSSFIFIYHLPTWKIIPFPFWYLLLYRSIPGGWPEWHFQRGAAVACANRLRLHWGICPAPTWVTFCYRPQSHRACLHFTTMLGSSYLSDPLPPQARAPGSGCCEGQREIWAT